LKLLSISQEIQIMPNKLSEAQKRLILERLVANRGDVARTASEFGIATTTIYRWLKQPEMQQMLLLQLQQLQQSRLGNATVAPLATDVEDRLRALQEQMLTSAELISRSVPEAVESAPLGQRVTALSQLTDRIIKLSAQLPSEADPDDKPFEIDYDVEEQEDEDETERPSAEATSESAENHSE
jgi:hypothetical protein